MKWLVMSSILLASVIGSGVACADDYTISTNASEQNTVVYWAARLSLTNTQALQEMCTAGIVPYYQQRTKNDAAEAALAFQQLAPANQAVVCAELATTGYTCPSGP